MDRELRPKHSPIAVRQHELRDREPSNAIRYGIDDLAADEGPVKRRAGRAAAIRARLRPKPFDAEDRPPSSTNRDAQIKGRSCISVVKAIASRRESSRPLLSGKGAAVGVLRFARRYRRGDIYLTQAGQDRRWPLRTGLRTPVAPADTRDALEGDGRL